LLATERGEDLNAALALAYLPTELLPRSVARYTGRVFVLSHDQTQIAERVVVHQRGDLKHLYPLVGAGELRYLIG
jgi:hypothetical protein